MNYDATGPIAVDGAAHRAALGRARQKAYWRLIPLLFVCYVIAYVDRQNVAVAALTMTKSLKNFNNAVIGFGAGIFFFGYFLLEIPGSIIVERWSARKWICRIMVSWGIVAAATALVTKPWHFYTARFLLGLAEAGFFPGVVVYLTHWFTERDRTRALAYFFIATPIAQVVSPIISKLLLKIGTSEVIDGVVVHYPKVMGLEGWQWIYIFWGIPAVILGIVVLLMLTDRPSDAKWLTPEERDALESELAIERDRRTGGRHMTFFDALSNPKVLMLALAYFCVVTANYGIEFFMPTILQSWYSLKLDTVTSLIILPPLMAVAGQLFIGWSSDRTRERRLHAVGPILIGMVMLVITVLTKGHLPLTVLLLMIGFTAMKSYLPAFWALPSLFLTSTAAAGSIGLINSVGNLGGFLGPYILGTVQNSTGSFVGGIFFLCASMMVAATILFLLGVGRRESGVPDTGFEVILSQKDGAI